MKIDGFCLFSDGLCKAAFWQFLVNIIFNVKYVNHFMANTPPDVFLPDFCQPKTGRAKWNPGRHGFRRATDGAPDGICETVPWHGPASMPADAVCSPPFARDKICFLHKFRHIFLSDMTRCFSAIFCRRKDGFALPGPENPAQQGEILLSGIRCGT